MFCFLSLGKCDEDRRNGVRSQLFQWFGNDTGENESGIKCIRPRQRSNKKSLVLISCSNRVNFKYHSAPLIKQKVCSLRHDITADYIILCFRFQLRLTPVSRLFLG